jgi:manganese/iron transport system substrate-binding protein
MLRNFSGHQRIYSSSWQYLRRTGTIGLMVGMLSACTPNAPTNVPPNRPAGETGSNSASPSNSSIKVLATSSVLCDLTQRIAQETVALKCLIPSGQDPHTYEATPADRQALETANLVLYNGYNFEPGILRLIEATPASVTKVAIAPLAVPKPRMGGHDHADDHDHAGGHDHDEGPNHDKTDHDKTDHDQTAKENPETDADPHIWHNARYGIAMVDTIQKQLTQVNPNNAATYTKNAQALRDRLTQIDNWIKASIATIPASQRKLVTTHDAMGYYSDAYGLTIEGALQGLSTETQPTPTRMKDLVDQIKTTQVPAIFAEVSGNNNLIRTIAQDAKVKLAEPELITDGLGAPGSNAETYETMLVQNTRTIVTNLGGKPPELP